MQYLEINRYTTLSELSDIVGERNVEQILAVNGLTRTPNIGKQLDQLCNEEKKSGQSSDVDSFWRKKKTLGR